MGAYRGKFGTPQNRLGAVEILRISRISRISRKIGIRRAPNILSRGDFGFFRLRTPVFVKYLGVSAKLAAWRNPPNPTLVVWADSVYPDHLCRMYHICIVGYLSREIRNISKTAWGLSRFSEFPEFPGFLVKLASEGLRIFFLGGILVFRLPTPVFVKYLGVSAKLAAWRNPPYPTLILWADSVYPDHFFRIYHIL